MLGRLIEWSVRNVFLVLVMTLAIVAGGIYALMNTPLDAQPDLSDVDSTVVLVRSSTDPECACVEDLVARPKSGKVQLVWSPTGAHHYNIYRGTVSGGPYLKIASTTSSYATYLDQAVVNNTTYYYVIREANLVDAESCQSNQASARPVKR